MNLKDRDRFEDLGGDGRMILNRILTVTDHECLDWIYIMQQRDKWRAVVNAVMNILVS